MGEGEKGGRKATEVTRKVTDGPEDSGRRQIMVTVVASSIND